MKRLEKIIQHVDNSLFKDRFRLQRELGSIKRSLLGKGKSGAALSRRIELLKAKAQTSAGMASLRLQHKPVGIQYDDNLPIIARKDEIISAIKKHPVIIISGETGSGKTTQIPKFCLDAGRGIYGMIGCTQPRRIAAITVSRRIAQELGEPLGQSVGYKIRFDDTLDENAYIKLMTDGILLAETQTDRFLNAYDTLIIDEAHERSLNIDFTLGILRKLIRKRKNLKLIITSATIDTQKFSTAFDKAPIIEVSGRMYPVQTRYMPFLNKADTSQSIEDQGYVEAAADAAMQILNTSRSGDILVFMPSEQDIGETMTLIKGKKKAGIDILPLFARLPAKEQAKVFAGRPGRKVVVATNVAETSLTIPGIKYVVDTGLARVPSYSPRTRTTALPVVPISQSAANQRMGRCGRIENGVCIRLFDEDEFNARPFFTTPQILRSNLAEVILRMISLNLGDISVFPFIDAPSPKSIKDGFDTLWELGAIQSTTRKGKKTFRLTRTGRLMAQLPIDPKLSRILIEAGNNGCVKEAAVIATALSISDPRQRPAEKAKAADEKHALFKDPSSDFITLLNIWDAFKKAKKELGSRAKLRAFCQNHFLSFKRMREWNDIHRQIIRIMKDHGMLQSQTPILGPGTKKLKSKEFEVGGPLYIAIHKSLLSGYLANIAHKKEKNMYTAAKGQQAMIFPGSGLFNTAGNWIVAAEFVKTSQLFARTVGNIDPAWLEEIGRDLCTRTYFDPHWEKKRGEVVAMEQVSLFGMIIAADRPTAYGRINPEEAGEIFIRHALVEGQISQKFEFLTHNQSLIDDLSQLEHKTRKKDILASPEDMFLFYQSRLPKPFYDIRTFAKFLKDNGSQKFLKMTPKDLQKSDVGEELLSRYPDTLETNDGRFRLDYRFLPGSGRDGVTINVPAAAAGQISGNITDRIIPGLFEEKIGHLIKALPKSYRIGLVPVSETAAVIARELPRKDKPLFSLLSEFIRERFHLDIPASAWSEDTLPDHLKMRISIRDHKGKEIKARRTKSILAEFSGNLCQDKDQIFESAKQNYEIHGITQWNFKNLEDEIVISRGDQTVQKAWPGLTVADGPAPAVSLTLFKSRTAAETSHEQGVCRLVMLCCPDHFKALKKDIAATPGLRKTALSFKNKNEFFDDIFNLITASLFKKNVRTKKEFDELLKTMIPELYPTGQKVIQAVEKTGTAYRECFELLQKLSFKYQDKPATFDNLSLLFAELKNLVPQNFLCLYPAGRIQQLDRYINCLKTRVQKTVDNPMKTKEKTKGLLAYTTRLDELVSSITPETSQEKSKAIEDFFWLLEEYKISLFAQHLKTNIKISPKKLDRKLQKLGTMI